MAAKKKSTGKKKKRRVKSRKKPPLKRELLKALVGMGVLLLLVAAAGLVANQYLTRKEPVYQAAGKAVKKPVVIPVKKKKATKDPARIKAGRKPPRFEIYPEMEIPHHRPAIPSLPPVTDKRPRIAIIIDDLGYDKTMAYKFIELDAALTFSILPHSTYQKQISEKARGKGSEIMLHLPMEPIEYPKIDPGPGALLIAMSPDDLIRQLSTALEAVPYIKGVNNHMGSRMTMDSNRMNQIFSVLKQRDLFFIDSRTTTETLSVQSARLFKVPFAQRDVFLDHVIDPGHVSKQIDRLIRYAQAHGEAVGIGHPHQVTYEVLRNRIPKLKQKVVLIPASQIVHPLG